MSLIRLYEIGETDSIGLLKLDIGDGTDVFRGNEPPVDDGSWGGSSSGLEELLDIAKRMKLNPRISPGIKGWNLILHLKGSKTKIMSLLRDFELDHYVTSNDWVSAKEWERSNTDFGPHRGIPQIYWGEKGPYNAFGRVGGHALSKHGGRK